MGKMLGEYTVKWQTSYWPLEYFLHMIDVSGIASYISYKEHNQPFMKKVDDRRNLLKNLARQLCTPSIETHNTNQIVTRKPIARGAVEIVLGWRIAASAVVARSHWVPCGTHDATPIVGSCYVCQELKQKQRKTRSCVLCMRPVCDKL